MTPAAPIGRTTAPGPTGLTEGDAPWTSTSRPSRWRGATPSDRSSTFRYGTDENKREWLPQITGGETTFALGYSEPDAGTDLANLRTRAELDGDEWIINGQKIWNSEAYKAATVMAHQLHGGMGYVREHDLHLWSEHAKACELALGPRDHQLLAVAAELGL